MSGFWKNLIGTSLNAFKLGISGNTLNSTAGRVQVRNNSDSAFSPIATSRLDITGSNLVAHSEQANTYTLVFPNLTSAVSLEFPEDDGSPGQVLGTNGSGKLSFVNSADTSSCQKVDTTNFSHGSASTIPLFTLPSNAVIDRVRVIVDTVFSGSPSLSIGVSGEESLFLPSSSVQLSAPTNNRTIFEYLSSVPSISQSRELIASYSANGATSGAARIEVIYSIPA